MVPARRPALGRGALGLARRGRGRDLEVALALTHHELCFGCGIANLFGLQMEVEPAEGGGVSGRFFMKQDHQGPGGTGHGGILALALEEAISLAARGNGVDATPRRLEVELLAPAPVGGFVRVDARLDGPLSASATAYAVGGEQEELARARAELIESPAR